jgi:hypothetical protein
VELLLVGVTQLTLFSRVQSLYYPLGMLFALYFTCIQIFVFTVKMKKIS